MAITPLLVGNNANTSNVLSSWEQTRLQRSWIFPKILRVQQEEVQSAYYCHTQVTIHPCVCSYLLDGVLVRNSVVFVPDDLKHDAGAVDAFISLLIEHLKMKLLEFAKLCVE